MHHAHNEKQKTANDGRNRTKNSGKSERSEKRKPKIISYRHHQQAMKEKI